MRRRYPYDGYGNPHWVLIANGIAGGVSAWAWLATLRWQCRTIATIAAWLQS